ncbi:FtsX-like permease family protein [Xanthobacter sp. AM11]|uniref:FtsX-like permease family protein n=1 Tax=Xanthobacter sp. AM11 TaxID=3380643 RepID=UPI0039BF9E7B
MSLSFFIAFTHVRSRVRQTVVGVLGVATGVGFSIMMAALMEGSQRDFIAQLVDALPHILVSDERRNPTPQPADEAFDAAEIQGLTTKAIRPGIKNPFAIMEALGGWVEGAVAPSVQAKAVVRFAGRDRSASIIGVDPRREAAVSKLPTQIREGTLADLYRSSSAIILGDGLARKLGVRRGNVVSVTGGLGHTLLCTVVAFSHTGVASADDSQAYVLLKTAQILSGQTGLVNEIRIKAQDAMGAREIAARIEEETGYKSVSWQEAHEDLLSAFEVRNLIMYMVVGAILLVASFGTYNIISTITHEKTRDIAILKSLGLTSALVRRIFVMEGFVIGLAGTMLGFALGYGLTFALSLVEIKSPFMDATHLPVHYAPVHYAIAAAVALTASLTAAYLPARKAAAVQPVDIIRGAS